ncbi:uncharacterized protein LOC116199165 [Punica granatum]|uniref:Uncharacterized protein n=2 Tax=Punica granatum TaxID=22663 RepID=A0A218WAQ4_PUNGR|nr:uncharacterized protein LOC116199165 [Punica granatum]OWM69579.1 hypothetical protein CDL15_Pgr014040 [Punica granatum]PKI40834.1 hypothetical protein CRG98_038845 [Punica granatum]
MGISCEGDTGEKECQVPWTSEERGSTDSSAGIQMEFWPLEHPTEPSDEDQPVKCPISNSSAINVAEMSKDRSTETARKRAEFTVTTRDREMITIADAGTLAARSDRKRHHTLTHGDIVITPIMRPTPSPPPNSACELTSLQMLHQTDSFEPSRSSA